MVFLMKRITKTMGKSEPNQAEKQAWMAYDEAMKTNKPTAVCRQLYLNWKALVAQRTGQ